METIKISNVELINALVPGLQELAAIRTSGKIAYNVAKTLKAADLAMTAFNDQKKLALEAVCAKDDKGSPKIDKNEYVFETDEIKQEAMKDITTLLTTEIDLDIYPISIDEFQALKDVSASTILRLGKFVTEPQEATV